MRANINEHGGCARGAGRRVSWFFAPLATSENWCGPHRTLEKAIAEAMDMPSYEEGAYFAPAVRSLPGGGGPYRINARAPLHILWGTPSDHAMSSGQLRLFGDLPLGARFRIPGQAEVLVAIETLGRGLVTPWRGPDGPPGFAGTLRSLAGTEGEAAGCFVEMLG